QQQLVDLYAKALAHGNEGVILKDKDSVYEYGQRGKSWLKFKKRIHTLNTVIMYAHVEQNNGTTNYSHYTLGISVKNDERYEEEFIPIGKISNHLFKNEAGQLEKQIKQLTVEKY